MSVDHGSAMNGVHGSSFYGGPCKGFSRLVTAHLAAVKGYVNGLMWRACRSVRCVWVCPHGGCSFSIYTRSVPCASVACGVRGVGCLAENRRVVHVEASESVEASSVSQWAGVRTDLEGVSIGTATEREDTKVPSCCPVSV